MEPVVAPRVCFCSRANAVKLWRHSKDFFPEHGFEQLLELTAASSMIQED